MSKLTREQLIALSKAAQYEFDSLARVPGSGNLAKIAAELGFAEVGGRWLKLIPGYASTVKQSVTTAGTVAGTTATIYETVTSPVSKIIASNTGTKVTTSGILTATSTSIGAVAAAAALGFKIGVDWFEAMPEFWTKVSNAVFQTDLKPDEIGKITRDTNALLMIKEGVTYMAEDLVTAIRDAFFDNGAADVKIVLDNIPPSNMNKKITVNTFGGVILNFEDIQDIMGGEWLNLDKAISDYAKVIAHDGEIYSKWTYTPDSSGGGTLAFDVFYGIQNNIPFELLITYRTSKTYDGGKWSAANIQDRQLWNQLTITKDAQGNLTTEVFAGEANPDYTVGEFELRDKTTGNLINKGAGSINAVNKPAIKGVTPTGKQGTKNQTIDEVFPEWVNKAVTTIGDTPDTERRWLPVTLPSTDVEAEGNPLTTTEAQTGIMPEPDTEASTQLQTNTDPETTTQTGVAPAPTPLPTPKPTITPTPTGPAIAGGGGSATGLANLYNPTLAQVKQFSRWLWGSDGLNLDQFKKLLQDPMQAIIGLHVIYATPSTGANRDIQVGYINSGVPSKIVTEQYTEIDCGTVTINEYFGDARDYSPYTQVYCYLPFIGIVELNADDVVNSTLDIKYKIDVLTGCCLAQLTVKKYGLNAVLYTYTGNCAVQMPITSGNYLSTVASLLGAVVSGAAAVATGGALAPVAIGAAANAMGGGARASVAMSGSLGSNAGAMGIRKPYLIIKRVESADANGYNEFYGYPTNKRVNLSQLTGYVRVKEIHLSGTNATEDEQNEIVTLLKEGVIL